MTLKAEESWISSGQEPLAVWILFLHLAVSLLFSLSLFLRYLDLPSHCGSTVPGLAPPGMLDLQPSAELISSPPLSFCPIVTLWAYPGYCSK